MPFFALALAVSGLAAPAGSAATGPVAAAPGPAAASEPSPEAILAHPETVNPFAYARLVQWLWSQGRRQQAAFWFYVFQERTRPWADADQNGAAPLRASLNDGLGGLVNRWVASDVAAWQSIVGRALAYEARLPLNAARPDGVSEADWRARVIKARADYVAAARQTLFTLNPQEVAANRRQAGLYVGPWQDPGPALPAAWR